MDEGVKEMYRTMLLDDGWYVESTGYKIEGEHRRFYVRMRKVHIDLTIGRKLIKFETKLPMGVRVSDTFKRASTSVQRIGK